jgi:hypothetical protein
MGALGLMAVPALYVLPVPTTLALPDLPALMNLMNLTTTKT